MTTPDIANLALDIIPSVIGNAITYLIPKVGRFFAARPELRLASSVSKNETVKTLLQKAAASISQKSLLTQAADIEALKMFLISPELDSIVKQIYSTKLTATGEGHLSAIGQEFALSLSLHLGISRKQIASFASALFDAIVEGCEHALERAIGERNMSALDARGAARHNVLLEEIELIKRNLEFLTTRPRLELKEILRFEERYRLAVDQRHGFITLPNLSTATRVPLESLYVPNNFLALGRRDEEGHRSQLLSANDLISILDRTVIVGNPGAGKSTFSQYICHTLALRYSKRPIASRLLTPILVVLRDYGAEKKNRQCSILDFIEETANSKYQIKPPQGALEYLLLNGRALVVFDGLDELLDSSYRREITADVESFCTIYPSSAVVVTSREVGYDQAPLEPKRFAAFRISEFDDGQVQSYATKRFAADDELSTEQKHSMPRSFLEESASVSDLRSNPLILGLMCTIYRGETYIPRNRPGVYEKCALMLFEKWDRSRQINVQITFEDRLGPVMKHLAHWIYSDTRLQAGVTESRLIEKATGYLHDRHVEDIDVARKTARDFIEFCRGRAWVFTDTGTTPEGELLYQFTHRTFLEYFTAAQLVRTHATPDDLGDALVPRIQAREWDIVAQLAFQIQNTNIEGAADRLIQILIDKADSAAPDHQWPLLSFGARTLEFLVPAPRIVRELTKKAIAYCVAVGVTQYTRGGTYAHSQQSESALEVITALAFSVSENRITVADMFEKELTKFLDSDEVREGIAAFDIMQHLPTYLFHRRISRVRRSGVLMEYWTGITKRLVIVNSARVRELASKSVYLAKAAFYAGAVSALDVAVWHNAEALFFLSRSLIFPLQFPPIVDHLLKPEKADRKAALAQLTNLAQFFVDIPPPWVEIRRLGNFSRMRFPQYYRIVARSKLTNGPLFAVFVLYAIFLESTENRSALKDSLRFVKTTGNPQISAIRDMLLARYETDPAIAVEAASKSSFSKNQTEIVDLWARKKIFFVGTKPQGAVALIEG